MILTGSEIQREVFNGNILITPFDERQVNPNSYNYRLAPSLVRFSPNVIDFRDNFETETIVLGDQGYLLEPGTLYLGATYEKIGSDKYVPSLIGRSSMGRLGLFLQITADLGHLGTFHSWTLELKVVQPLRIYPQMRIGQVSFWKPTEIEGANVAYGTNAGSYACFSTPKTCNPEKFFN